MKSKLNGSLFLCTCIILKGDLTRPRIYVVIVSAELHYVPNNCFIITKRNQLLNQSNFITFTQKYSQKWQGSKKTIYQKQNLAQVSLNKAILIFKYAENHKWKFYVGLVFLLLTGWTALTFPSVTVNHNYDRQKNNKVSFQNIFA